MNKTDLMSELAFALFLLVVAAMCLAMLAAFLGYTNISLAMMCVIFTAITIAALGMCGGLILDIIKKLRK